MKFIPAFLVVLLLATPAAADVLVMKDGRKLSGRVRKTRTSYEITIEGQRQVFALDDVQRWIKSPKEMIGQADQWVDEAKEIYLTAVEIQDLKIADKIFRKGLEKVYDEVKASFGA